MPIRAQMRMSRPAAGGCGGGGLGGVHGRKLGREPSPSTRRPAGTLRVASTSPRARCLQAPSLLAVAGAVRTTPQCGRRSAPNSATRAVTIAAARVPASPGRLDLLVVAAAIVDGAGIVVAGRARVLVAPVAAARPGRRRTCPARRPSRPCRRPRCPSPATPRRRRDRSRARRPAPLPARSAPPAAAPVSATGVPRPRGPRRGRRRRRSSACCRAPCRRPRRPRWSAPCRGSPSRRAPAAASPGL